MKLAIVLIASLAQAASAQDAVGTRIAQSAAAAERLQGPLDGTWTLHDVRGRTLFVIQIGDPPSGGMLSCAWRTPVGPPHLAECRRNGARLIITFDKPGKQRMVLHSNRAGIWRGRLIAGGAGQPVSLRRG